MKNRFIKLLLAAVLLGSLSPAAAQTREMDLSGEWRFQTDVMDFRRGSLSPRYNHQLQETIMLPGITDDYKIGYKSPYRHVDRLRQAGFQVADIDYAATFTEAERRLYALPADHMYVVYKV